MSFLNSLLLTLIKALHTLINNYALTIIVFTILIKLVVMPLNLKSRRSTMRMTTIQPKAAALQEKYKDDQEKLNQKLQELYRKEGINRWAPACRCSFRWSSSLPCSTRCARSPTSSSSPSS